MAIFDRTGRPYKVSGSLQQFDPENPEFDLFNLWDEEAIKIGGSPIFYYEVFIQSGTVDPQYHEDRGKIFSNNPVQLYAFYEPIPSKHEQTAFGIDSIDDIIFELNYRAVLRALGHPPKIGSRMYSPHLKESWQYVQPEIGEFKMWGAMRLKMTCSRFQESTTTGEGKVSQKKPDFKIN